MREQLADSDAQSQEISVPWRPAGGGSAICYQLALVLHTLETKLFAPYMPFGNMLKGTESALMRTG
jgi:hypothetical protein